MRSKVLLSRVVGRDPFLFCSADSQASPSNCWMMAGQICLKCSLEIGKWGFRAKISTSWLAEKHTWLEWEEKTSVRTKRSLKLPSCSFQLLFAVQNILYYFDQMPQPYLCPVPACSSSFVDAVIVVTLGLCLWTPCQAPPLPIVRMCDFFPSYPQLMK